MDRQEVLTRNKEACRIGHDIQPATLSRFDRRGIKREVSRSDVDPPEFDAVEPNNCPIIDDQSQPQLGDELRVRHVERMTEVNAEVASAVAGWKRRDDP